MIGIDVNKEWTPKDQDKDKDQTLKDKDKNKDPTCKYKDTDKDFSILRVTMGYSIQCRTMHIQKRLKISRFQ